MSLLLGKIIVINHIRRERFQYFSDLLFGNCDRKEVMILIVNFRNKTEHMNLLNFLHTHPKLSYPPPNRLQPYDSLLLAKQLNLILLSQLTNLVELLHVRAILQWPYRILAAIFRSYPRKDQPQKLVYVVETRVQLLNLIRPNITKCRLKHRTLVLLHITGMIKFIDILAHKRIFTSMFFWLFWSQLQSLIVNCRRELGRLLLIKNMLKELDNRKLEDLLLKQVPYRRPYRMIPLT